MSEQVGSVTRKKSSDFHGGIRFQSSFTIRWELEDKTFLKIDIINFIPFSNSVTFRNLRQSGQDNCQILPDKTRSYRTAYKPINKDFLWFATKFLRSTCFFFVALCMLAPVYPPTLSTVITRFQFSRKQNGGLESSETTVTRFSKCGTNFIANRVQDTSNPGMGSWSLTAFTLERWFFGKKQRVLVFRVLGLRS